MQTQPPNQPQFQDTELCFMPKANAAIHRPLLNITEYLSSSNLCMNTYEDRLGVKIRGETLNNNDKISNKRHRADSGSDKRSPDSKKIKNVISDGTVVRVARSPLREEFIQKTEILENLNGGHQTIDNNYEDTVELTAEISLLLCDNTVGDIGTASTTNAAMTQSNDKSSIAISTSISTSEVDNVGSFTEKILISSQPQAKVKKAKNRGGEQAAKTLPFKPLISDDVIKKIRKGWTISNAADITLGDLYVVFGQDSKLDLEYYWTDTIVSGSALTETSISASIFKPKLIGMPFNTNEYDNSELISSIDRSPLTNKLKHLLLIANLSERIRRRQCLCGHFCDKPLKMRVSSVNKQLILLYNMLLY